MFAEPPTVRIRKRHRATAAQVGSVTALALLLASPAEAALEVRSAELPAQAQLTLRLDACATPGPLVQVREADGSVRLSLHAADLEITCAEHSPFPSAATPGEGSWVQDWWVNPGLNELVLVHRETGAPRVISLRTGDRVPFDAMLVGDRLRDDTLWPREQLRALDLAAAWSPIDSVGAIRGVLGDRARPPVVRLRAAALLSAFGDDAGRTYLLAKATAYRGLSGLRPRSGVTGADLGELASRTGGGLLCDRPPPAAQDNPDDPIAARQYAIQLLPSVMGFSAVPHLRALVRGGDPLDRIAVRTALLCLALRLPDDDPRAQRIANVARWTGGGAGLSIDGPSLRELEASAGSPDRYVAGQAIRSLLARDDGTEGALLRLLARGTPHDGLVALYFATHPSERAVEPLLGALHRHPNKSRAAELLVMALRACVPSAERDALVAAHGASPARWKQWAARRAEARRARIDPVNLLTSLLPLALLMAMSAVPRRRP